MEQRSCTLEPSRPVPRRRRNDGATLCELDEITGTFTTPDVSPYPELPSLPIAHDDHRYRGDVRMVYGNYSHTGTPAHRHTGRGPGLDWTDRAACVEFSAVKGGPLTAYRWSA